MTKKLLLIFVLLFSASAYAQTDLMDLCGEDILTEDLLLAKYASSDTDDGDMDFESYKIPDILNYWQQVGAKFISRNVKYPVVAQENGIQGRVIVGFVIDTKNRMHNVRILRGVDSSLDKEALRVVRLMQDLKADIPAKLPECVSIYLPVVYKLAEDTRRSKRYGEEEIVEKPKPTPPLIQPCAYTGGEEQLSSDLKARLSKMLRDDQKIEGTMEVRVWVNEVSAVFAVDIIEGINPEADAMVARALRSLGGYNAAFRRDQALRSYCSFKLEFPLK